MSFRNGINEPEPESRENTQQEIQNKSEAADNKFSSTLFEHMNLKLQVDLSNNKQIEAFIPICEENIT